LEYDDAKVVGGRIHAPTEKLKRRIVTTSLASTKPSTPRPTIFVFDVTHTRSPARAPGTATVVVDSPPATMFGKSKVFTAVKLRLQPKSA
jgi:hypothetical protein